MIAQIKYTYKATPERLKQNQKQRLLLALSFYFSGIIYFILYYLNGLLNLKIDFLFFKILFIVYVLTLFHWHFYFNEKLKFKEKTYIIDDNFITIKDKDEIKRYTWKEIKFFRKRDGNFVFYIGPGKEIFLNVEKDYYDKVYSILKLKLEEK